MMLRSLLLLFLFVAGFPLMGQGDSLKNQAQAAFESATEVDLDDEAYASLSSEERRVLRKEIWQIFRASSANDELRKEFEGGSVKSGDYMMPFFLEKRGSKPEGGWPVVMAMHGGGNAPKRVNDSQWEHMKSRYRIDNCIYIALRAPTDEWNGFYTDYVYPLIHRLCHMLNVAEEINPDRVYILGYSHGGYGAFSIGPKMPDHFGAVHSSAAAPTKGETAGENLMNLRFTYMVGEHDEAYGRLERCQEFETTMKEAKERYPELYPVEFEYREGKQHSNLEDHDKPQDMAKFTRNPLPERVRWTMTDKVINRFYWLGVTEPVRESRVEAFRAGNEISLRTKGLKNISLFLNDTLIDVDQPLVVKANGKEVFKKNVFPALSTLIASIKERADPAYLFDIKVDLEISGDSDAKDF